MLIKKTNSNESSLLYFDLLGRDELALSKAFSYTIAKSKDAYFEFLKLFKIHETNSTKNFKKVSIHVEKQKKEGRVDIEIISPDKYQIIIEAKVRKNKLGKQRTQYIPSFKPDFPKKILCFITQERDTNKELENEIEIYNFSWKDIIDLFNKRKLVEIEIVQNFLRFLIKHYQMNLSKEILIQDLGISSEIKRFVDYNVYRRDMTFGTPLYFAPYFTRGKYHIEGIPFLSKILGILTITPNDLNNLETDLRYFTKDEKLINLWIQGVSLDKNSQKSTFYFLDQPFILPSPLLKDKGKHKGVGKGWISSKIPKNRTVSFSDFLKHIPEIKQNRL